MGASFRCKKIIQANYTTVYRYCCTALAYDAAAAEDCTQEVFLIFLQKQHTLDLTKPVLPWLYTTARTVVYRYRQSNPCYEDLRSAEGMEDPSYAARFLCAALRSYLTDEEYQLLYDYYNADHGSHMLIAKRYGLQLSQMYERVRYIKQKLKTSTQTQKDRECTAQTEKNGGPSHAK